MAKCKIKFNRDIHVTGVEGRVLYDYKDGQVAEVDEAERRKWLNRGYCSDHVADAAPAAPAEKVFGKDAGKDSGKGTK